MHQLRPDRAEREGKKKRRDLISSASSANPKGAAASLTAPLSLTAHLSHSRHARQASVCTTRLYFSSLRFGRHGLAVELGCILCYLHVLG